MIGVEIGSKTFPLPENWDEVFASGKYLDVVEVNFTETDPVEARKKILFKLLGMDGLAIGAALGAGNSKQRDALSETINEFTAMQIVEECFPVLDFIFTPELFTKNPLPHLVVEWVHLYGPADNMAEQSGAEMEECGWAYAEFIKTKEEYYLDHLIASMYRPRDAEFDRKYVPKRAKKIGMLDPIVKRGILLWYQMVEESWKRQYEFLYEQSGEGEPAQQSPEESSPIDSLSISRIVRMLAGTKRGTVEDVRKMERQEIFFELAELEREREEAENSKR
jgi:hypothetical protein